MEQKHLFKGYDIEAVDYLFKPLEPEILKSKVKVFVNLNKQKKALENSTLELKQIMDELHTTNKVMQQIIEDLKTSNDLLQQEIIARKRAEEEKRDLESKLHQAKKMESIGTLPSVPI